MLNPPCQVAVFQKAATIGSTAKASRFTRSVYVTRLPESAPPFGIPVADADGADGLVVAGAGAVGMVDDLVDDGLSLEDSATADEEGLSSLEGSSSSVEDVVTADG